MSIISDSFRVILWFALCVAMAFGMIVFALFYGLVSFMLRNLAWKQISISLPSIKLAK